MSEIRACNCVGPRPGEPRCPCMMRGLIKRDGRWIEPERDLGPIQEEAMRMLADLGQECDRRARRQMTHEQDKQIASVKIRIMCLQHEGATDAWLVTELRREGWAEAAIKAAMEESK